MCSVEFLQNLENGVKIDCFSILILFLQLLFLVLLYNNVILFLIHLLFLMESSPFSLLTYWIGKKDLVGKWESKREDVNAIINA